MVRSAATFLCLLLFATRLFTQSLPGHPVADTCSRPSFFNYYASPDTATFGSTLCRAADGGLYLGGSQAGGGLLLLKMSAAGERLWSRTFWIASGREYYFAEIIEDSDGQLVACGSTIGNDSLPRCFILRYDPLQDTMLWVKLLEEEEAYANGIVELTPGGNYLLNTQPHNFFDVDNGGLTRIDRHTGNSIGNAVGAAPFAYNYGVDHAAAFSSMAMHDGSLYAVGRYSTTTGNTPAALEKTRCVVNRFDPFVVAPVWTRLTHVDTSLLTPVIGRDLLIDHDTLLALSYAQDSLPLTEYTYFFLQKFSLQGELLWIKRYYIPIAFTQTIHDLVATPDGYVLYGSYSRSSFKADFILKLDKSGNIQWAKYIDLTVPEAITGSGARQNTALAVGNSVYVTGIGGANPLVKDLFLLKINGVGDVSNQCGYLKPLQVISAPVLDPANIVSGIAAYYAPTPYTPQQVSTTDLPISTATQCTRCADASPDCEHLPDLRFHLDSMFCFNGDFGLVYTICNVGDTTNFSGSVDLIFFYGNPFTHAEDWRWRASHGIGSTAWINGGCSTHIEHNLNLSAFSNIGLPDSIFIVLNVLPAAPLPYNIDTLVTGGVVECNYHNNVIVATPLPVDLGPDKSVCAGESVVLHNLLPQTIPGFISYQWQDGSTDPVFTAHGPGLYWLELTNDCGGKRRDTILINALPPIVDSVSLSFCPGDFVVVNQQTYTQPGTVTVMIPAAAGCDTLRTYHLHFLPQPTKNQVLTFCPGSSVAIGDSTYTQPGIVTDTLAATTGCDTIVTYLLQYTPLQTSQLTITCPADQMVETAVGSLTALVQYALPAAVTDCPCDSATTSLTQGLQSGAAFPVGTNTVCYQAADACGSTTGCCFTVTVQAAIAPDTACDLQTNGCLLYELLHIYTDAGQNRTYRIRVTNLCSSPLLYTAMQLPDGIVATAPLQNAVYTAPGGHTYNVRNPNASPFYSIRFRSLSDSIANGASDIFEYTLPAQAAPVYIHVTARLASQLTYEAHLNVFNCPVEPRADQAAQVLGTDWRAFPNPTTGLLQIELPLASGARSLVLYNALGERLLQQNMEAETARLDWNLGNLNNGIYYLRLIGGGEFYRTQKIVVQR